ncbi:MAG: thioredoxin family protein, partial [Deltaproteobacteria bacterium]|nr:thioredoxin family protein [Deltaproteobacteria bacterium]
MEIKVLGAACARCDQAEKNVREALSEIRLDAKVEKVTNL